MSRDVRSPFAGRGGSNLQGPDAAGGLARERAPRPRSFPASEAVRRWGRHTSMSPEGNGKEARAGEVTLAARVPWEHGERSGSVICALPRMQETAAPRPLGRVSSNSALPLSPYRCPVEVYGSSPEQVGAFDLLRDFPATTCGLLNSERSTARRASSARLARDIRGRPSLAGSPSTTLGPWKHPHLPRDGLLGPCWRGGRSSRASRTKLVALCRQTQIARPEGRNCLRDGGAGRQAKGNATQDHRGKEVPSLGVRLSCCVQLTIPAICSRVLALLQHPESPRVDFAFLMQSRLRTARFPFARKPFITCNTVSSDPGHDDTHLLPYACGPKPPAPLPWAWSPGG